MLGIDLSGRSALVTGAAAGIGAACVRTLGQAGARTVGVDLAPFGADGPDVGVTGDITDPAVRAEALRELGAGPAILVNNAAVQYEKRLGETTDEEIDRLFAVNVKAPLRMMAEFADQAPDGSSIVIVASVLGVTGDPGLAVYTTTKGAMVNLTRTAALEYAGRLRVNAVLPGAIRTPLTTRVWAATDDPAEAERRNGRVYPAGRIGEPAEVAAVVAFLASDLASFMTGALVAVDGGLLAANAEWGLGRL